MWLRFNLVDGREILINMNNVHNIVGANGSTTTVLEFQGGYEIEVTEEFEEVCKKMFNAGVGNKW